MLNNSVQNKENGSETRMVNILVQLVVLRYNNNNIFLMSQMVENSKFTKPHFECKCKCKWMKENQSTNIRFGA